MHHCEGVVVTCEDFRLHQRKDGRNYIAEFMKNLGNDCDLITRGGGVQDLVRPKEGFDKSVLRDIDVSDKLHAASKIFLVAHQDCGAYSTFGFKTKEEEFAQHKNDLVAAREILNKKFPGKENKIYFAWLKEGSQDEFEIKEITD
jgi:carbonic anhydrase